MSPFDAPTGSVWEMNEALAGGGDTIFVVLDGYERLSCKTVYRRAFVLTRGVLQPFAETSWMDTDSKRLA